jgi:hypothetical protein
MFMAVLALFWLFPTRRCSGGYRWSNIEDGRFIVMNEQMTKSMTAMSYSTLAIALPRSGDVDKLATVATQLRRFAPVGHVATRIISWNNLPANQHR